MFITVITAFSPVPWLRLEWRDAFSEISVSRLWSLDEGATNPTIFGAPGFIEWSKLEAVSGLAQNLGRARHRGAADFMLWGLPPTRDREADVPVVLHGRSWFLKVPSLTVRFWNSDLMARFGNSLCHSFGQHGLGPNRPFCWSPKKNSRLVEAPTAGGLIIEAFGFAIGHWWLRDHWPLLYTKPLYDITYHQSSLSFGFEPAHFVRSCRYFSGSLASWTCWSCQWSCSLPWWCRSFCRR